MITGYVSIKGAEFKKWIDSQFPLLCQHLPAKTLPTNNDTDIDPIEHQAATSNVEQAKKPTSIETDKSTYGKEVKSAEEKENPSNDTDLLWEENERLKNAMCILEKAIASKSCSCSNRMDEKQIHHVIDQKVATLEKIYDDKLATFTKTL